jgi:hypothetical protein
MVSFEAFNLLIYESYDVKRVKVATLHGGSEEIAPTPNVNLWDPLVADCWFSNLGQRT